MYIITFKILSRWKHRRIRVAAPAEQFVGLCATIISAATTLDTGIPRTQSLSEMVDMQRLLWTVSMATETWRLIAGIFGIPVFLLCLCILVSEFIRCFNELKQLWHKYKNGELFWFSIFIFSLLRHIIFRTTLNLFYYGTHWFFKTRCTVCWYAAYQQRRTCPDGQNQRFFYICQRRCNRIPTVRRYLCR